MAWTQCRAGFGADHGDSLWLSQAVQGRRRADDRLGKARRLEQFVLDAAAADKRQDHHGMPRNLVAKIGQIGDQRDAITACEGFHRLCRVESIDGEGRVGDFLPQR